jgi:uncharacterized protein (TIGR02452 family)
MQLLREKNRHSLDQNVTSHFSLGKDRKWGRALSQTIRKMCAPLTRKENKVFHVYDNVVEDIVVDIVADNMAIEMEKQIPMVINPLGKDKPICRPVLQPIHSGVVILAKGDSIECVRRFLRKKKEPRMKSHRCLLLNYANATTPGGGWENGDTAQEEMLFYRSNYFQSLEAAKKAISGQYITPMNRCIISPHVYVWGVFHEKNMTIDLTRNPDTDMILPMIAAAAVNHSQDGRMMRDQIYEEMSQLWDSIFKSAICMDIDHFFIGPIGCGVFVPHGDHKRYRKISALALADKIHQYHKYFQSIIFCDYVPNRQYAKDDSNYTIFSQVLSEQLSNHVNVVCDYCDDPTCKNVE